MTAPLFFLSILKIITLISIYNFILNLNLWMSLPLVFWLEDWAVLLLGWDIADSQIQEEAKMVLSTTQEGFYSEIHRRQLG